LTADPLVRAASENLVRTYFHLGLATEQAQVVEDEGFRACVGMFEHPICNFAASLDLDPWSARRLRDLAADRPAFSVYALPGDRPAQLDEILVRAGFRPTYRLTQMVAETPDPGPGVEMVRAETHAARQRVARFMSSQFFTRQTDAFRANVSHATVEAAKLELYELEERGRTVAAAMICREGECTGLYNLCVAPRNRGKGIGRAVVDWALGLARTAGTPITLQCDGRLETWYASRGFRTTGYVEAYALPKPQPVDIMTLD